MAAITLPTVQVTAQKWTLLSSAAIQTLQMVSSKAGVIYSDTEPDASIKAGEMGHVLQSGEYLVNATGGTSWGRSTGLTSTSRIAITEG